MNLDNSPLKKLKEKKGEAHTPTISTPFSNNADVEAQQIKSNIAAGGKRTRENARTTPTYIETEKHKKSDNIKYNLIIDKQLLFILKAVANYNGKPINETLSEALKNYFAMLGDSTINNASDTYNQLLKLKGVNNGN